MHVDNKYWYFKSVLSPDQCRNIIDSGLSKIEESKKNGIDTTASTYGDTQKKERVDQIAQNDKTLDDISKEKNFKRTEVENKTYIRDSEVSWLNEKWLYDLILPYLHSANKNAGWKYDIENSEAFQFTVYRPGGFYGWHLDGHSCHNSVYKRFVPGITPEKENGDPKAGYTTLDESIGKIRKLSMTINLNSPNDYEGGNLNFDFGPHNAATRYHECVEIRPQGSIIVFPSYTHHQVTPVTRCIRYSLVLWSLGKPFR